MEKYAGEASFPEAINPDEVELYRGKKPTAVFWRRLFAFFIDGVLLGIVGSLLGLLWYDFFIQLGNWGRLIGFAIALIYFVPLDSHLGNGQTIGKRLMKIKVVDWKGDYISPAVSFFRYLIVALAIFLNGLYFKSFDNPAVYAIGLLFFGSFLGTIYFYLFNKRTHQSLNDVICGTFVVRKETGGAPTKEKISKKHYYIFSSIMAVLIIYFLFVIPNLISKNQAFNDMVQLQNKIQNQNTSDFKSVRVFVGQRYSNGKTNHFLRVNISVSRKLPSCEDMAKKVAASVIQNYPKLKDEDNIGISFVRGYDIGISYSYKNSNYFKSESEWKKELGL